MPISHIHRCVFIHIPKTGGTSIESALGMFHRWQDENTESMFGLIQSPALKEKRWITDFLQHLSYSELATLVPSTTLARYFSFAWVRNPWERFASVYCNTDHNLIVRAAAQGVTLKGLSFADFVAATEGISHVHLQPQHSFVLDSEGRMQVDYLGRFENLVEDFHCVTRRLGLDIVLPHKNASRLSRYQDLYDSHSRRLVERRYGADIERWKYCF